MWAARSVVTNIPKQREAGPRFAARAPVEFLDGRNHSALILASRMTLLHFSMSALICAAKSSGVVPTGS